MARMRLQMGGFDAVGRYDWGTNYTSRPPARCANNGEFQGPRRSNEEID